MKLEDKAARVALVVPAFPKLSETFIVNKFLGLVERGFDVHVVCSTSEPEVWNSFEKLREQGQLRERVHVNWTTGRRWRAAMLTPLMLLRLLLRRPAGTWRYLARAWPRFGLAALRRLYLDAELLLVGPDAIHFEFGALARNRTYLKDLLGCKLVVSFRGYDLNYVGLEQPDFYREVWREADGLHFLGEDLWARAQRRGCPPGKLRALIPPAIDLSVFAPESEGRRAEDEAEAEVALRVLSVGRLEWKKGYEYALQAVRRLIELGVNCEYRIVGDGDYLEAVAFARHQLGLDEQAHLLGALNSAEVKEQMQWADIFLHAAVSEGFCNAVLEAQAMGLPVVCTNADGLAENVAEGETGYVVQRRNAEQLAERMLALAENPEERQRMGEAGRRRVSAHFNLSQQMDGFAEFYRQVLSAPVEQAMTDYERKLCDERAN